MVGAWPTVESTARLQIRHFIVCCRIESFSKSRAAVIFFSRLEFVPAQINGQKNTIAARDLGLWVGCTAVLLLYCLLYRDPRSMPPNTVRTSSQHSTPAHLVWLFFFTVPLASEVVLNGGRAGASGPRPSGALVPLYRLYYWVLRGHYG